MLPNLNVWLWLFLQELCQKIIKGVYNTPAHVSAEAKDLLARMLTVVPDHRITFQQVHLSGHSSGLLSTPWSSCVPNLLPALLPTVLSAY